MLSLAKTLLILQCCGLCLNIRVPIVWDDSSDSDSKESAVLIDIPLRSDDEQQNKEFAVETFEPQSVNVHNGQVPISNKNTKPIPIDYFQYPAVKPQFAINVASFHGVKSPETHYRAYPIVPYTDVSKPALGKHRIVDDNKPVFQPIQKFANKNEGLSKYLSPVLSNYEVFHPYKAEIPGLTELYKDPILQKIRNDLRENAEKSQKYRKEVEDTNITKDEHLRSPSDIDKEKVPQRNIPARYEIHNSQRRPVYYTKPLKINREKYFMKKYRHPWNHNFAKIMPSHYRPLEHHLQQLKQYHAQKYEDERNEYPQITQSSNYEEPSDGYDIYQNGKERYIALRNNVDNAINEAKKESHPNTYQKLELQSHDNDSDDDEEEFIPIKNYAQVRKTETTKHLPKDAALQEATTFDEIRNAPRLREAIKSTKAQTIYTEEGYEDSAYDHAGEQKHASEQEGHGGYLKEKEDSKGKFKTPSWSASYEDGRGSDYGDKAEHGEKWKNDNKDTEEGERSENFAEEEQAHSESLDSDEKELLNSDEENDNTKDGREKRNNLNANESSQHDVNKREVEFQVPVISLNDTYLTESEILQIAQEKIRKKDNFKEHKYPYYSEIAKLLDKNSPLRYAENLNFIPKKSDGGTEFYDSRSFVECPEVYTQFDPIPEKIQNDSVKNDSVKETEEEEETDNSSIRSKRESDHEQEQPRLKGLGDKIDCLKNKYFGENPLDSPFFSEGTISQPDPIVIPAIPSFKLIDKFDVFPEETKSNNVYSIPEKLRKSNEKDIFELLDKLKEGQIKLQTQLKNSSGRLKSSLYKNNSIPNTSSLSDQSNVYSDVIQNIRGILKNSNSKENSKSAERVTLNLLNESNQTKNNDSFNSFKHKEDVLKPPFLIRRKRANFVYEPYKVIRDNAASDSKKTTTTSNISPLIKQLQSSRIIDSSASKDETRRLTSTQPTKRDITARNYKDISKEDRKQKTQDILSETIDPKFVDVSTDVRRGEPRYELVRPNHKAKYTPVENKKSISLDDFKSRQEHSVDESNENDEKNSDMREELIQNRKHIKTTIRPYFDVSMYLPRTTNVQNQAASKSIHKVIKTTTPATADENSERKVLIQSKSKQTQIEPDEEDEDEYDDYEQDESDEITTTTLKSRIRILSTTTPVPPQQSYHPISREYKDSKSTKRPKLKLVTRFHENSDDHDDETIDNERRNHNNQNLNTPKFSEKTKKSSKSTVVTDSKTYGEGNDDMKKEEIDALIGVSQNDEYMPSYEKAEKKKVINNTENENNYDEDNVDYDENKNEYPKDVSEDDDEEDSEEDDEDDDEEDSDYEVEELKENESERKNDNESSQQILNKTINKGNEEYNEKYIELKPITLKKKLEIHKELPVNKTLPHFTQFKEDIKEEEIIRKIPQKNVEVLDLYKDENLATNVNKLADVEVFKKDLDIHKGPRHGGNYRSAKLTVSDEIVTNTEKPVRGKEGSLKLSKEDAEVSQTKNSRYIEFDEDNDETSTERLHGGNLKSFDEYSNDRNSRRGDSYRNAKIIEMADDVKQATRAMHGGNLKSISDVINQSNQKYPHDSGRKNEKIIELTDGNTQSTHGGNFRSQNDRFRSGRRHGNSHRKTQSDQVDVERSDSEGENEKLQNLKRKHVPRGKAADLLNSFAQAVPILTTTPAYILDPSKRMYYYVE